MDISAECLRCGTCCQQGGPALHREDLRLVEQGILGPAQLLTVRRDEPAREPLQDKVLPSKAEFIKIKGRDQSWSCLFFAQHDKGCLIYQTRPLECRLLFCRNTAPVEEIIGRDLLTRQLILARNDAVLPLLSRLEDEVPYRAVNRLLAAIDDGFAQIATPLADLVRRDLAVRDEFLRDFPKRQREELFLFGRPLFLVLAPYDIRLVEMAGGIGLQQGNY